MALFRQRYAVDTNGQPLYGVEGRIYALDDTEFTTPLPVTDFSQVPIVNVSISETGVNQAFFVEEHTQVVWKQNGEDVTAIFESLESMEALAREASTSASSAVQQISSFITQRGKPGGLAALDEEGNVVDANDRIVGDPVRAPGSVVWQYGATSPRPTANRDVLVLWLTEEGVAPENALPGVDIWLNQPGGVLS